MCFVSYGKDRSLLVVGSLVNFAICGKRLDCIVFFFSEIWIGVALKM
jgi:hypothetical protein